MHEWKENMMKNTAERKAVIIGWTVRLYIYIWRVDG